VKPTRGLLPLLTLLCLAAPSSAADLGKVDRTLRKEPAYKGQPQYCLLVFGPEAKTRVWLVRDGDTLYVDRDGSGDLTDPAARVPCARRQVSAPLELSWFYVGGAGAYKHLVVGSFTLKKELMKDPRDRAFARTRTGRELGRYCRIWVEAGGPCQHAAVLLAGRPADAPVVHFGGPLVLLPPDGLTLSPGKEADLTVRVGTPGRGRGRDGKAVVTTTFCEPFPREEGGPPVSTRSIPADVHPVAEIAFPNRQAGGPPVRTRVVLRQRC
jgi:hypothetical protein